MLRTPQKGNQQGQCPCQKGITPNRGHHTTAYLSPAPAPGPPGRRYSGRGGYGTEEQESGERKSAMGLALVPSRRGVHLKGMQCSPGACAAGGPEAETRALGCQVKRRTRRCRCPSHLPLRSSPRTAPSGHTALQGETRPGPGVCTEPAPAETSQPRLTLHCCRELRKRSGPYFISPSTWHLAGSPEKTVRTLTIPRS